MRVRLKEVSDEPETSDSFESWGTVQLVSVSKKGSYPTSSRIGALYLYVQSSELKLLTVRRPRQGNR